MVKLLHGAAVKHEAWRTRIGMALAVLQTADHAWMCRQPLSASQPEHPNSTCQPQS